MKQASLEEKQVIIRKLLQGKLSKQEAEKDLNLTRRTVNRYVKKVTQSGIESLQDKRGGNHRKLTAGQELQLVEVKQKGYWRSARKALELTGITSICQRQVQKVWVKHNLQRTNIDRLKPISRFVANLPNDLWQADIMGKMYFPHLGYAYLVGNLDDCSRYILGARWFSRQTQLNVFRVWYHCLFKWGMPKAMLQDKGSQYKSTNPRGEATYQYFAQTLGIRLIFAHKAQTKGKIERLWRFIQQDFVRENKDVKSFEVLNQRFFAWQKKYNNTFESEGIGMGRKTPAQVYQPSERRRPKQELQSLLTLTVRRYVYRDSTISLFGVSYKIPPGYIGCRIWLHLKGDRVFVEGMGKIVVKFRLKV